METNEIGFLEKHS